MSVGSSKPRFYRSLNGLNVVASEPLIVSFLKYRAGKDRVELPCTCSPVRSGAWWRHSDSCPAVDYELVSSRWTDGKHRALIDLDFPHYWQPSTTAGHAHLYLDQPLSWWRWALLMFALRRAGMIEQGFAAWSIRRGANFVRSPLVAKTEVQQQAGPQFGWLFPRRPAKQRRTP